MRPERVVTVRQVVCTGESRRSRASPAEWEMEALRVKVDFASRLKMTDAVGSK